MAALTVMVEQEVVDQKEAIWVAAGTAAVAVLLVEAMAEQTAGVVQAVTRELETRGVGEATLAVVVTREEEG